MRRLCAVVAIGCVACSVFAEKPKFEPYGFVKGDMYIAIGSVSSWGKPSLTAVTEATGLDTTAMGFSAQHTRFGVKGSGATGDITMGGQIELDFFVIAANANAKPRMRLAYAWCKPLKGLEIRVGQDWDLFSPLNPSTFNTNGNLWFSGNHGFRRPQIMLGYLMDLGAVKPNIKVSGGEATREDDLAITQNATTQAVTVGSWLGADNLAMVPMLQGRIGVGFAEKMEVGVGGVYAAYTKDRELMTGGVGVDVNLPIHKAFGLAGEFAYGSNFNNANLFTVGGSGKIDTVVTDVGFWVNISSKPLDFLQIVLGVGDDIITSDVAAGGKEGNMSVYGDLVFPIGEHFSIGVEYQYIRTAIKDGDPLTANVIDIAGKVNF